MIDIAEAVEYRTEGIREFLEDLPAGDREWVCGEESPKAIAREWVQYGFNALGVREWAFRARCFRAEAARALIVLGLNPEDCRALNQQGDTVGYAVANGDMSPQDALLVLCGF